MRDQDAPAADAYTSIGRHAREHAENLYIQCWAAEQIGSSYPLNQSQTEIVLGIYETDKALGEAIAKWKERRK